MLKTHIQAASMTFTTAPLKPMCHLGPGFFLPPLFLPLSSSPSLLPPLFLPLSSPPCKKKIDMGVLNIF